MSKSIWCTEKHSYEEINFVYPDPNEPYTLFTDASKYAWFTVLTKDHTTSIAGKMVSHQHPMTYVSGILQSGELNWATLILYTYQLGNYHSIWHMIPPLSEVTTYLWRGSFKRYFNANVNNWGVELSDCKIKILNIKVQKFPDTQSRLNDLSLAEPNPPEMEGHEYQ